MTKKSPLIALAAFFAALLIVAACGKSHCEKNPLAPDCVGDPTVTITAPTNGSSYDQGATVGFQGSGTDPEDGALTGGSLAWTSSLDNAIGTGTSFSKSDLSAGQHTITLTATDSGGGKGTATRSITINSLPPDNQPPTATITAPADGSSFDQGIAIGFQGTGTDPEDGVLTGSSLVWTSSLDNAIGTGTSLSKSDLSAGQHTITLTATDSDGGTGTATASITVTQVPGSVMVSPGFTALDVVGAVTLSVTVLDLQGASIPSPSLQVVSRNPSVASSTGSSISGVAPGVTDIVVTAGTVSDSVRIAVVDQGGFAALVSTSTSESRVTANAGSTLTLDLLMIRPPSGTAALGSVQGKLQWDPAQLSYQSSGNSASGWTWIPNEASVSSGTLDFSAFSPTGTAATLSLVQLTFTVAGSAGTTSNLDLTISVAGDDLGTDITAMVQAVDSDVDIQ